MANPGDQVPYGDDFLIRRINDVERKLMEGFAARSLAASQIGSGGELLVDGSLRVTGSITVPGVLAAAGGLQAGTTVTAGTNVVATNEVIGNHATFVGGINSLDVYGRLLTYGGSYAAVYVHQDGNFGFVPSSRRYKQDIETFEIDAATVAQLRVVSFRYIAAVNNPDYVAVTEIGLIAEEVHALGLTWLVDYDSDGLPQGVKYERLAIALIPWMASIEARLTAAGI
jgi:hypothetical protein